MFFLNKQLYFSCQSQVAKGPYIKQVEGRQTVFVGFMKHFRHMLMGHEILFKIFDGPQNIFLCSTLVILFFKLRSFEHKISKIAI